PLLRTSPGGPVSDDSPARLQLQRGATVWLTGLPSAGKSPIADGCEPELRARGLRVEVLDGDAVRPHLAATPARTAPSTSGGSDGCPSCWPATTSSSWSPPSRRSATCATR